MSPVNLNRIQYWINQGRLNPRKPITLKELNRSGCIHGVAKDGVKLLGRGKEELTSPINIVVSRASAEAISAVEAAGGTVTTRYYTDFAIRKIIKGRMDPIHSLQSRITMAPASSKEGLAGPLAAAPVPERKKFEFRLPDPVSRKHLEYYRDSAHRGYLSHLVEEGHGPSLFFKTPGTGKQVGRKAASRDSEATSGGENRLW